MMKKKLWIFGDSFSMDYSLDRAPWCVDYIKFKGYNTKSYGHFLAEDMDMDLEIFAEGGSDNYTIFNKLCDNVDYIKSGDMVIIGWGPTTRFRLVNEDTGRWMFVNQANEGVYFNNTFKNSTINELLVNRMDILYEMEVKGWVKIINKAMNNNNIKVFYWSWIKMHVNKFERVCDETNNIITDGHWSENGHKQFSEYFLKNIINKLI